MSDTGVSISVYVHGLGISVLINKYVNNTFVGLHIAVMCFVLCKCLLFVMGNKSDLKINYFIRQTCLISVFKFIKSLPQP